MLTPTLPVLDAAWRAAAIGTHMSAEQSAMPIVPECFIVGLLSLFAGYRRAGFSRGSVTVKVVPASTDERT
jgi:hypothetical protein